MITLALYSRPRKEEGEDQFAFGGAIKFRNGGTAVFERASGAGRGVSAAP